MNEKILGILIGVVLTVAVIQVIGIVVAHGQNKDLSGVQSHMSHRMSIGSHMQGMECMEMELEDMDKNEDGLCDICGMSVEHCASMISDMSGMTCHK